MTNEEAINVLRGQESAYWDTLSEAEHKAFDLAISALKLLKEQEPVAPVMVPHSRGIAYNCGYCGTEIDVVRDAVSADAIPKMHLYCRMCGGRIKW